MAMAKPKVQPRKEMVMFVTSKDVASCRRLHLTPATELPTMEMETLIHLHPDPSMPSGEHWTNTGAAQSAITKVELDATSTVRLDCGKGQFIDAVATATIKQRSRADDTTITPHKPPEKSGPLIVLDFFLFSQWLFFIA
jgi:hypothetical protein